VTLARIILWFALFFHGSRVLCGPIEVRKITIQDIDGGIRRKVWGSADEETRTGPGGKQTRETTYKNARGETVQRDVTTFDPANLEVSAYQFENFVSGELVSVEAAGEKVRIRTRDPGENHEKIVETKWKHGAAFGKLLDRWIEKNQATLAKGEYVPVELYIPSKADSYGFRLRFDRDASKESEDIYVMEARNWFIRLFIPRVEFQFEKSPPRRLRRIVGPYPLLHETGNQGKQVLFTID